MLSLTLRRGAALRLAQRVPSATTAATTRVSAAAALPQPMAARARALMQGRRSHHFDTRKFATELEKEGLSPSQADAVLRSLDNVLTETTKLLAADQVSRSEFSKRVYQQKVDFTKLTSELQSLDRADFGRLDDDYERMKTDVEKTRQQFKETVAKARANVRLDLNLEKGRVREESAGHELKLQELNARIDQELSNFKTQIEGTKIQVLQWLIGVCTGTFALVLAYIRLLT